MPPSATITTPPSNTAQKTSFSFGSIIKYIFIGQNGILLAVSALMGLAGVLGILKILLIFIPAALFLIEDEVLATVQNMQNFLSPMLPSFVVAVIGSAGSWAAWKAIQTLRKGTYLWWWLLVASAITGLSLTVAAAPQIEGIYDPALFFKTFTPESLVPLTIGMLFLALPQLLYIFYKRGGGWRTLLVIPAMFVLFIICTIFFGVAS